MSKTIPTQTSYLEMLAAPEGAPHEAPCELELTEHAALPIPVYRELYDAIGSDFLWINRKLMSDTELAAKIHAAGTSLWTLDIDGTAAGFVEIDFGTSGEAEIVYFGLRPEFHGRGLGRYFLDWVIRHCWSRPIERLWLHTCDLDHERALGNYLQAGFVKYDEKTVYQRLLDEG